MAVWRLDGQPRAAARRFSVYSNYPLPTPEDRLLFILAYIKTYAFQVVQGRLFCMGQSKSNQRLIFPWGVSSYWKEQAMHTQPESDAAIGPAYVSTGRLPFPEQVRTLVAEAYERYKSNGEGQNSQIYPALARVPSELFGICVVGTNGNVYACGDADYEFTIMSVSKPFVFALVCQEVGWEVVRQRIGVNATGLAFNSLAAIEQSPDGRTNPMVNAGAIATTSLVPGATLEARW